MSGWIKYPYLECADCRYCEEIADLAEDDDVGQIIVNHPSEICQNSNCPHKGEEDENANPSRHHRKIQAV
jgi:hypothetical protein